jgi:hypothetical protein
MFDASQNTLYQFHAFVGTQQFCRRAVVEQRRWSRKPVCGLLLVAENRNCVRYYGTKRVTRSGEVICLYPIAEPRPPVSARGNPTSG